MTLNDTLGNMQWVRENEEKIKNIFPETWTHAANINNIQLMFQMKLIGIPWSTEAELLKILTFLTKIGIVQVSKTELIRRNPHSIFPEVKK